MNPETIYELTQLYNGGTITKRITNMAYTYKTKLNKIDYKPDLRDAIVAKSYIIGSYYEGVGISFSINPSIHTSEQSARAECRRLAALNPDKTYLFVQLKGAEEVVSKPQNISI